MKKKIKLIVLTSLILSLNLSSHSNYDKEEKIIEGQRKSHIPVVNEELDRVGIEEHIGSFLDKDISFYTSQEKKIALKDLIKEKPIVLTFAYYSCPLICQFVLQAQKKAMRELDLKIGTDFQAITVSFDVRDKAKQTKDIESKYVDQKSQGQKGWSFLYGTEENIKALTDSVGFKFKWIEANQEFAHSAAIYVVTPNGKISRYFYGLNYDPFELKLALLEAKQEKVRSTVEKILLYCYRYDHDARGYVLHAWNLMKAGGITTIIIMASFIFIMFRKEKKLAFKNSKTEE